MTHIRRTAAFLVALGATVAAVPAEAQTAAPSVPFLPGTALDSAVGPGTGTSESAPEVIAIDEVVRMRASSAGRSGALRLVVARVLEPLDASLALHEGPLDGFTYRWEPLHGTPPEVLGGEVRLAAGVHAPSSPGYWRLVVQRDDERHEVDGLTLVTKVPFDEKRAGRLNGYLIGHYPMAGQGRTDRYAPPAGFIEVTPATANVHVSRHLRLGQFLTKNQFEVWPKYVALDLLLIDKLELVMQELHAMGVRADRMHVMSGFRTPHYNGPGGDGRAFLSRHTYGDAADIWIENGEATGYIADLNGDGVRDPRDAEVIMQAVERVEQRYPELTGGVGVYRESGSRGPYVHIDVRGSRSRW
jgi:uncharacterized protein YcbK (DUF882 family)